MIVTHEHPVGWVDTDEAGLVQPSEVSGLVHVVTLEVGDLLQGPQGDTGLTGPQGVKGDTGLTGPQGVKGDTGLTGAQGVKGDTGLTGEQGLPGSVATTLPGGVTVLASSGMEGGELHLQRGPADNLIAADAVMDLVSGKMRFFENGGGFRGAAIDLVRCAGGVGSLVMVSDAAGDSLSFAGRVGYGAGAGGIVVQSGAKDSAVTLNKPVGQVVMSAAALAAGAVVSFVLQNSRVSGVDSVLVSVVWNAADPVNYSVRAGVGLGAVVISLRNESGISRAEAVTINFAVIKGAIA